MPPLWQNLSRPLKKAFVGAEFRASRVSAVSNCLGGRDAPWLWAPVYAASARSRALRRYRPGAIPRWRVNARENEYSDR